MQTVEIATSDKYRAYRRRKVATGRLQSIADLPRETLAYLDEIKERQGLRNRGQVLEQPSKKGGPLPRNTKASLAGWLLNFVTGLFRRALDEIAALA